MSGLRARWSRMSRAWRAFWLALIVTLVFFFAVGLMFDNPALAIVAAVVWAAGASTLVRMRDHYLPPDEEPRRRP